MAVAVRALAVRVEALRHDQVQMILGARHGDVEQAPLFLDLGLGAGRKVRRDAAVDGVEQEDRFPFLALGGMDGRENQIILVEQRHAGLVAGRVRRIERELGEEALAARISLRDLHELDEIGLADHGVLVNALEMRLVPAAHQLDLGGPAGRPAAHQPQRIGEGRPIRLRRGWRLEAGEVLHLAVIAGERSRARGPRWPGRRRAEAG